jgi:hypothetical protein
MRQNWFDACVDRCGGNRHGIKVITTKAPAGGLAIGADGIIYLAFSGNTFAGYLADYEVKKMNWKISLKTNKKQQHKNDCMHTYTSSSSSSSS